MLKVVEGLTNTIIYGNDIVIYSDTWDEHTKHVVSTLERIKQAGLRINRVESQFAKQSVVLLGHMLGQGKIQPLSEKLLTMEPLPVPKSKRDLRRFLGRVGFYSRFIKDFSEVAKPLYELLKKGETIQWSDDAQRCRERIHKLVTGKHLTLQLPEVKQDFVVSTDASDMGIGAVLKQKNGIVEYANRVLTQAEQKYSTTEKECLAIVWALDKWRPYLMGRRFHIETDHKPLEWIKSAKDPRGKLARWTLRLQEYDFTISHVPGRDNHLRDILSR